MNWLAFVPEIGEVCPNTLICVDILSCIVSQLIGVIHMHVDIVYVGIYGSISDHACMSIKDDINIYQCQIPI